MSSTGAGRYDGVSYVTQCPIPPGTNFTYTIPVNDPPGTYFWHEHSSLLRADGLQVSHEDEDDEHEHEHGAIHRCCVHHEIMLILH